MHMIFPEAPLQSALMQIAVDSEILVMETRHLLHCPSDDSEFYANQPDVRPSASLTKAHQICESRIPGSRCIQSHILNLTHLVRCRRT
jgi:hypothetical protein